MRTRVIPTLLISNSGLVKSIQFKNRRYIGDPINAVRLFNEMEVDELIIIDVDATKTGVKPNLSLVQDIVSEAFMPISFGGGINKIEQMVDLFSIGIEKAILTHAHLVSPAIISEASRRFGAQAIVAGIDAKRDIFRRYRVFDNLSNKFTQFSPAAYAAVLAANGAGEIFINDIDRDGKMNGYNIELIRDVAQSVDIPVICCGGAGSIKDLQMAASAGASGVAAGSLFVYKGAQRGILINYPTQQELTEAFNTSPHLNQ